MKKLTTIILWIIGSCISAQAQNGVYLEYNATQSATGKPAGVLKIYSSEGNSRVALEGENGAAPISEMLYLKDVSYMLFNNKTYTISSSEQLKEYKVRVIGEDTANGYACTRILLTTYPGKEEDLTVWISNSVPDLNSYLSAVINNIDVTKLNAALNNQNLSGIPIRIADSYYQNSLKYDLRHAEVRKIDSATFDIKDYKKAQFRTADDLKKDNEISKEKHVMMKLQESEIRKMMLERDSIKKH